VVAIRPLQELGRGDETDQLVIQNHALIDSQGRPLMLSFLDRALAREKNQQCKTYA
jgi:hypothetical protein